jgi:xeroderma pigmentosum group C-complementing protein
VSLLANARIRNRWASDSILKVCTALPQLPALLIPKARLLSLLPHPLQAALVIPPKRFPDRAQRSRMFFEALQHLVTWWSETFYDISDATLGLRTRPWDEVQEIVDKLPKLTKADFLDTSFLNLASDKLKGKGKAKEEEAEEKMEKISVNAGGERLRTVNSLMKKALKQEGSRDVSAILFVSLARACNLGVRLVTSLQPVPWRAEKQVAKKKPTGAGKGGKSLASRQGNGDNTDEEDDEDDMEEVHIPLPEDEDGGPGAVMGKVQKTKTRQAGRRRHLDPADVYRLRAPKPAPKTTTTPKKRPNKLSRWSLPVAYVFCR